MCTSAHEIMHASRACHPVPSLVCVDRLLSRMCSQMGTSSAIDINAGISSRLLERRLRYMLPALARGLCGKGVESLRARFPGAGCQADRIGACLCCPDTVENARNVPS